MTCIWSKNFLKFIKKFFFFLSNRILFTFDGIKRTEESIKILLSLFLFNFLGTFECAWIIMKCKTMEFKNMLFFFIFPSVLISDKIEERDNLRNKTLKISDLGLAREVYNTTRMSAAGTYAWMSPETIKCGQYSK